MSFLQDYFGIAGHSREAAVCCPFDHYTGSGIAYKETNPSASVNTVDNVFHCMSCGAGFSEPQFIQETFGCSVIEALKIQTAFEKGEDLLTWEQESELTQESIDYAKGMGISEKVLKELRVKTPTFTNALAFPVFVYDRLTDIRTYNKDTKPKVKSRAGCPSGLIIPFDIWKDTSPNRITLICAGEKDMAVARTHGFNAITFTGGENNIPKMLKVFEGRKVAIVYDNDETGRKGAKKLANALLTYTQQVKVVTGFHEVCSEEKEDIADFFNKYKKTKEDLIKYIEATPFYEPTLEEKHADLKHMSLLEATNPNNVNKVVVSNVQIVAVSEDAFTAPTAILGKKLRVTGDKDTMQEGESKSWELAENNTQDIIHLIDNNFKQDAINKNIRDLLRIPQKEKYITLKVLAKKTVFKCYVTDLFETTDTATQPMEFAAYSIGVKLESGKKYAVTHKLIPHPYQGQKLIMIITDAVQANDSVSNFVVDDTVKARLKQVQEIEGTVEQKIFKLTDKVKGLIGYDGNDTLIQAIDLSYHTALQFNFGTFKDVRGYLDTIIVGESRVGKSSTADALRKAYGLGVFTSLAGNSATIPGLVGGSNKTASGGFQTRAGIIPQNNKGLVIFEEFGKSSANIVRELTDIRSSNEVRITRVSGTITLPAMVRMVALTNVKNTGGGIKPIASYPNGISVISELVDTAEDIARYDLIVILSDRGNAQINPFWEPDTPLPPEVYQTRVRWVWSRTSEQVLISKEVGLYIIKKANELNQQYECHIKIFGTEAWKKLARLSVAVAGYLVSTDETYENIIVTEDHVDFAVAYLISIYDNSTFKLREYVGHERKFSTIDEEGVGALQEIYNKHPGLILQLEQSASATKNMLGASSGLSNDDLNKALNRLTRGLFVRFQNHDIVPTERFRLGLAQIERKTHIERLGE